MMFSAEYNTVHYYWPAYA